MQTKAETAAICLKWNGQIIQMTFPSKIYLRLQLLFSYAYFHVEGILLCHYSV